MNWPRELALRTGRAQTVTEEREIKAATLADMLSALAFIGQGESDEVHDAIDRAGRAVREVRDIMRRQPRETSGRT